MEKYLDALGCLMIMISQLVRVFAIAVAVQGTVYQLSGRKISIWNIYKRNMLKGVSKEWTE
ncbi:MAG: hypothetical protein J6K45_04545 [Clostridia bacterium]|nr:hypothetical protein [Clostridia bacterium]